MGHPDLLVGQPVSTYRALSATYGAPHTYGAPRLTYGEPHFYLWGMETYLGGAPHLWGAPYLLMGQPTFTYGALSTT